MKILNLSIVLSVILLCPFSLFSSEADTIPYKTEITLIGDTPLPYLPEVILENDNADFGYGPLRSVEASLTDDSQLSLTMEFNERPTDDVVPSVWLDPAGGGMVIRAYWDGMVGTWDYFMERYGIPIGGSVKAKAVGFAKDVGSKWEDDPRIVPWFVLKSGAKAWWHGMCYGVKNLPSLVLNQVMIPKNMLVPLFKGDLDQSIRSGVDAEVNTVLLVATAFGLYKTGSFALDKVASGAQVAGQLGKGLVNPGQAVKFVTPEGYMFGGMVAGTGEVAGSCVASGPSFSGAIGPIIFFQILGPDGGPVEKLPLSPKRFREELTKFGEKTEDLIKRAKDQSLGVDDADYSAAEAFNNARLAHQLGYDCRVFHYRVPRRQIGFKVENGDRLLENRYVTVVTDKYYHTEYAIRGGRVIFRQEHEMMTNPVVTRVADFDFERFSEIVSSNPVVQFIKNQ